MLLRPIHHSFGPHADRQQCLHALRLLVQPGAWQRGEETEALRATLKERFHGEVFLFATAREGLLALLRSLTHTKGEEVIVQGYTCMVVPNAIQAAGCTPVFADIDPETLNLHLPEVEAAITPKTRAIICQHTFGIPADTKALRELCDTHSLHLIEDCAHVMPDETGPREIGKHGDFLVFSLGRDKAISGITGGAVICRQKDLCATLAAEEQNAEQLSRITIARILLYPLFYTLARPVFGIVLGKALLWTARRLRLILPILTQAEKEGNMSPNVRALPNACAALALQKLRSLKQINDHRRALTKMYLNASMDHHWPALLGIRPDLPLQKFPLFTSNAEQIRHFLERENIHLDDGWTGCVICPDTADGNVYYEPGTDPAAEQACTRILTLPTHPLMSERDVRTLTAALSRFML